MMWLIAMTSGIIVYNFIEIIPMISLINVAANRSMISGIIMSSYASSVNDTADS